MTKERLKSPRARLFVALDLPDAVRQGIAAWGRKALADHALRPVRPGSLHITLAFLGWLPEKEVPRLGQIVEASGGGAPAIRLSGPVQRPERGRPRLFALAAESPGTIALQARLGEDLIAAGLYEPEKRPFWPHVTVARVSARGTWVEAPGTGLEASWGAAATVAATCGLPPDDALPF